MRYSRSYRNQVFFLSIMIIAIMCIGVGYAFMGTDLSINGSTVIKGNKWDVHFENAFVAEGSISDVVPTIVSDKSTTINYSVNLNQPGDYYLFYVDVVNKGSIDAMVNNVTLSNIDASYENVVDYSVSYANGNQINQYDKLVQGTGNEQLKVLVKFREDVTSESLPTDNVELDFSLTVEYVQADANANDVTNIRVGSFRTDSWDVIASNVQTGNVLYTVGETKEVNMGDLGTKTVRIANTSECTNGEVSETACGFVIEFVDSVAADTFNFEDSNIGGWNTATINNYVNTTLYDKLPVELKDVIIDTNVVSSHGLTDTDNFTTTNKLYLLSTKEIYGKDDSTNPITLDTSDDQTRQLDYYSSKGINTLTLGAIKNYNDVASYWWTRSAVSDGDTSYYAINATGAAEAAVATSTYGISPAFRIG